MLRSVGRVPARIRRVDADYYEKFLLLTDHLESKGERGRSLNG